MKDSVTVGGITKFLERKLIKLLYDHKRQKVEGRFNRLAMGRSSVAILHLKNLSPVDGMTFATQSAKSH